ncbi:hypothetical protein TraAM80_01236 [Trypanosoma rangeli]|uniref:Uncharacterized protein n=1 Tax=Trypanosoma rangeli TaxID=5698 RepID=A0A3R7N0T7_TRYRA|nr:uncharacterized protein TraAM80_01236 [Trypanosoma rangeli]RNF10970.1 hypothetical protein TraAM80_01236 [Trypanosoma rangeli]|eukprot:RNF10970.1 hypothetical protein TraAM80_01236 [Trypanosoma rangeli]
MLQHRRCTDAAWGHAPLAPHFGHQHAYRSTEGAGWCVLRQGNTTACNPPCRANKTSRASRPAFEPRPLIECEWRAFEQACRHPRKAVKKKRKKGTSQEERHVKKMSREIERDRGKSRYIASRRHHDECCSTAAVLMLLGATHLLHRTLATSMHIAARKGLVGVC